MIALHAWGSSDSIRNFRERYPDRPLIVALSGTDIYYYLECAIRVRPCIHSRAIASLPYRISRDIRCPGNFGERFASCTNLLCRCVL